MLPSPRIRVEPTDGARVVRFIDRQLFDDKTVREVSEQLLGLLPSGSQGEALILDFQGVEAVSSAMLGKLILLHRRLESASGQLRLCGISQNLLDVIQTTNLDRLFQIDRDYRESLAAIA